MQKKNLRLATFVLGVITLFGGGVDARKDVLPLISADKLLATATALIGIAAGSKEDKSKKGDKGKNGGN